jgi:hypothetical protein
MPAVTVDNPLTLPRLAGLSSAAGSLDLSSSS